MHDAAIYEGRLDRACRECDEALKMMMSAERTFDRVCSDFSYYDATLLTFMKFFIGVYEMNALQKKQEHERLLVSDEYSGSEINSIRVKYARKCFDVAGTCCHGILLGSKHFIR
jgi:hypothetical protein